MTQKAVVSAIDQEHYRIIRRNVSDFLSECARRYDGPGLLLDIAPQIHEGAAAHFTQATIHTLDIDAGARTTYTADICGNNGDLIPGDHYAFVVCTEVLEHTLEPFAAAGEIYRILKPGGLLFLTSPFNFRIHGPLPDCWRFTEHGLRALLKRYTIINLHEIKTPGRDLMPIQYTIIAQK